VENTIHQQKHNFWHLLGGWCSHDFPHNWTQTARYTGWICPYSDCTLCRGGV